MTGVVVWALTRGDRGEAIHWWLAGIFVSVIYVITNVL